MESGGAGVRLVGSAELSRAGLPGGFCMPEYPRGVAKLKPHQAKVLEAYYAAVAACAQACANGSDTTGEVSSDEGSVAEPESAISFDSSASSGKARKRARRRARKAEEKRARLAAESVSGATYTPAVAGAAVAYDDDGYSYLRIVKREHVADALVEIGQNPTFGDLLAMPAAWFHGLSTSAVERVRLGVYRIVGAGMVAVSECLASVVQAGGREYQAGQLGALPDMHVSLRDGLLRRAPDVQDVCGDVPSGDVAGLCYLKAVVAECQGVAYSVLGRWPVWRALLSSPAEWFDLDHLRVEVAADEKGHIGIGCKGPHMSEFLAAMLGAHGLEREAGTLAGLVPFGSATLTAVPPADAVCGGKVAACLPCSVESAYELDGRSWRRGEFKLTGGAADGLVAVETREGATLCVFLDDDVAHVVPLSKKGDLRSDTVGALFRCREHERSLGACGCRPLMRMGAMMTHVIRMDDVAGVVCTGACKQVGSGDVFSQVEMGVRVAFARARPWKASDEEVLLELAAYRALGGYPSAK